MGIVLRVEQDAYGGAYASPLRQNQRAGLSVDVEQQRYLDNLHDASFHGQVLLPSHGPQGAGVASGVSATAASRP